MARTGPDPSLPPEWLRQRLGRIAADRSRGARALSLAALSALDRWVRERTQTRQGPRASELRALAPLVRSAQPFMASFQSWADELERYSRSRPEGEIRTSLRRWIRRERRAILAERTGVARTVAARSAPAARYVTLSRSSTILAAFRSLPRSRRPREVIVLESLPGGEGRATATDLRRAGLAARWVPDPQGPRELARSDAFVLGADTIFLDGSVLHKVGTRRMARAARRLGKPTYVISGRSKALDRLPPQRAPTALFDLTPGSWVTEFWTDQGAIPGPRWRDSRPVPRRR